MNHPIINGFFPIQVDMSCYDGMDNAIPLTSTTPASELKARLQNLNGVIAFQTVYPGGTFIVEGGPHGYSAVNLREEYESWTDDTAEAMTQNLMKHTMKMEAVFLENRRTIAAILMDCPTQKPVFHRGCVISETELMDDLNEVIIHQPFAHALYSINGYPCDIEEVPDTDLIDVNNPNYNTALYSVRYCNQQLSVRGMDNAVKLAFQLAQS